MSENIKYAIASLLGIIIGCICGSIVGKLILSYFV